MSFHDKRLFDASKACRNVDFRAGRTRAMLRGIREITLNPSRPRFAFGSLRNDFEAIGRDMRNAINSMSDCD